MTYRFHLFFSLWISWMLLQGAAKAFVHALVPPLCANSTSSLLVVMSEELAKVGCVEGVGDARAERPMATAPAKDPAVSTSCATDVYKQD